MLFNMKPEPKKKLPNKKVISSPKFEAKEQFTKSALENLKTENERLLNSLKKSGEIKESKRKQNYIIKNFLLLYYFYRLRNDRKNHSGKFSFTSTYWVRTHVNWLYIRQ